MMRFRRFLQFNTIAITAFLFVFIPGMTKAEASPVTLGLSPAVINVKVDKGAEIEKEITVANMEDVPMALRAYAENFEAADPFGGMKFNTDDASQYSSRSWLNFKTTNLVLAPREQKKFIFTIEPPRDAEPGGHYSVIFFEPISSSEGSERSNLGITQRVGALLFITVNGNNIERGEVLGASTTDKCTGLQCSFKVPSLLEWGPVPFSFDFQNTGNVHVKVGGTVEIYNLFGQKIGEVPFEEKTVLPSSSRHFEAKWLREVLFGRYSAKLKVIYGDQQSVRSATTSFWVIPWRFILVLLLALIVSYLVRKIFVRKRIRNTSKTAPEMVIEKPKKRIHLG